MPAFRDFLADAYTAKLADSNGKVNQTDRNTLRNRLLEALASDLNAVMTADGAVVEFEHDYWGSLCVEISLKMKDPNFDLDGAVQEYDEKQELAAAKRIEVAKRAAERQAKSDALKSARESKGTK